ncbi:hypothetical protein CP533_5263 [Ophiocordyceps camponoti-saundersi (nom. inval.)]|nr:hypothetical protein CP533_5263 [Ophiocordyceps camponoti-saundersi (nom. inval.)]
MPASEDLISFDVIEEEKENIQSLPGGRSAKKLAELVTVDRHSRPSETKTVNDSIRAEYEAEIEGIAESDDPLNVFDRYVRWTLDAYPTAQASPQSQLHTLLERATKAFISSASYQNDPRYLKLWMHYIHFFVDTPRETFLFLSRHGIGESLALFYEEYAAWLEAAGRWVQAAEVYRLGIEREARPLQRLLRKFTEFRERLAQQPAETLVPASPALPTIRPALAAKLDPFASSAVRTAELQPRPGAASLSRPSKPKLAIFSDADAKPASVLSSRGEGSKGWDTVASLADRKKENTMKSTPWTGETLKAGDNKGVAAKVTVFRDASLSQINNIAVVPSRNQVTIHPQSGKRETILVDLAVLYPTPEVHGTELSFEEIVASNRGWLQHTWDETRMMRSNSDAEEPGPMTGEPAVRDSLVMYDENGAVVEPARKGRPGRTVVEVNETQIIKAKLDSPSGPKLRKKNASEPTMTLHTKSATDDIYNIFNAPLSKPTPRDSPESGDEDEYETDADYTTDAESTGTTRPVDSSQQEDDDKSVREWSDVLAQRHAPDVADNAVEAFEDSDETRTGGLDGQEEDLQTDEVATQLATRTVFVPVPPEDYDAPTRPYRDPVEVANNRLPFMTPITERTECSLEGEAEHERQQAKTPSKGDEYWPDDVRDSTRLPQPPESPVIKDRRCNPVDEAIRRDILDSLAPPLASYRGFHDHREERYERGYEIRKHIKAVCKAGKERTATPVPEPILLRLPGRRPTFGVKRELGAGAFAPVYLVQNLASERQEGEEEEEGEVEEDSKDSSQGLSVSFSAVSPLRRVEALKMESPPSAWEFHMMRLAHARLGPRHRAVASLSYAHELHLYRDEAFLFLPYHANGTLLDVVNFFRAEPSGVMDELLVMFFAVELLRTVDALHAKGVMHGDLKPDNCMLRLDPLPADQPLAAQWHADGSGGWSARGLVFIDFGRSIDMTAFTPDVEFVADWKTGPQDCPEVRESRPWTWQIDYHGLAATIHCLLFGKYMETTRCDQGNTLGSSGRKYRIREALKRYWQTELWGDCFELLLNPASSAAEHDSKMPLLQSTKEIRRRMERWLEANCDRGVGLRSLVTKLEAYAKSRR